MKVKLTARDPTQAACDAGEAGLVVNDPYLESADLDVRFYNAWEAAHDAAPDDATRALVGLLWAVQQLRHGPNSEYAVHARYVDTYLGKFAQTDEGAALIRQAEERDDG